MAKRDIIAIGGSAGSGAVLKQILAGLPADFRASVFISTHLPTHSPGYLAEALSSAGPLPVKQAIDGAPIESGQVYVAVADRHLLLVEGVIRLGEGPRENMVRPSIDPFFRSAALSYGPRAVGVILTGMLNDGASGLNAIKSVGGTAVVQHPIEAEVDQMPLAALESTEVDHVARASELAALLAHVAATDAGPAIEPAEALEMEVEIAAGARLGSHNLRRIADPSPITCPDCQGVLSELREQRPLRYRCQTGHASTAEVLAARIEQVDEAVQVAMRIMEERVTLVERMAEDARNSGRRAVAELYDVRAQEYHRYATTLRQAAVASVRMGRASREQEI